MAYNPEKPKAEFLLQGGKIIFTAVRHNVYDYSIIDNRANATINASHGSISFSPDDQDYIISGLNSLNQLETLLKGKSVDAVRALFNIVFNEA